MRLFGLIGYPLGHSFSARWFAEMFADQGITEAEYLNLPLESIEELPRLLENRPDLAGFNVTIPYKESIIPYLTWLSPDAAAIGAVNCITRHGAELKGYNTDWRGFRKSLEEFLGPAAPQALILGSGGASKAVAYALESMGIKYKTVSTSKRGNGFISYNDLDENTMSSHLLIVNTTPLGTWPDTGASPAIPYRLLTGDHFLFDLVYNPSVTRFMREGLERGCKVRNGYGMLEEQARLSWEIFDGL